MTDGEFASVMAVLEAGSGTGRKATREMVQVYWDLLNDLPIEALRVAAKRALLEGSYPLIPPVGVLRKLAIEAMQPRRLDAGEAWGLVRQAVRQFGFVRPFEGLQSLPGSVRTVVRMIGWDALCESDNPEAMRAHFLRMYSEHAEGEQREALLPAPMATAIEEIRRKRRGVEADVPTLGESLKLIPTKKHGGKK